MRLSDCVVVGNGVAGFACASQLARLGISCLLVGPGDVVDRPALTKKSLETGAPRLLTDDARLSRAGIERLDGVVVGADLSAKILEVSTALGPIHVQAAHVVLAPGLHYAPPPVPGLEQAHVNATPAGLERLARSLGEGRRRLLIVGGGLIGAETAATLAQQGHYIHVIDVLERPVHRLRPPLPDLVTATLTSLGVQFTGGVVMTGADIGSSEAVVSTVDHGDLAADLVIAATGGRPVPLPGLPGAVGPTEVDEGMKLPGYDGVYVIGDAASPLHARFGRLRLPHWDIAVQTGEVAARRIAGEPAVLDAVPYWWSELGPRHIAEYGLGTSAVEWSTVDDLAHGRDAAGRLVAVLLVDQPRRQREARLLLAAAAV
jgi:3-phenylpropionate/trans-cinnamate dioxygenase ferredoxin reductase subunit